MLTRDELNAALRDACPEATLETITAVLDRAGFDVVDKAAWENLYLDWRGFATYYGADGRRIPRSPCPHCGGSGVKSYGSTATWHGGAGGQMITTDVCDACWGSGDDKNPWPSHREFYAMKKRLQPPTD